MSKDRHIRRVRPTMTLGILILLVAVPGSWAQKVPDQVLPGRVQINDLELVSELVLEVDGAEVEGAKFFYSEYDVAHVIVGPGLPTVLISPRGDSVQKIEGKKLVRGNGLAASLDSDAVTEYLGEYEREFGDVKVFQVDGQTWKVYERDPQLGRQSAEGVSERHPRFAQKAEAYGLSKSFKADELHALASGRAVKAGRPGEDVLIRMYFTSGSQICERLVPKMMRAEQELRSQLKNVRFEYYGLPKNIMEDPMAQRDGLNSVPSLVAYVGEERVALLQGRILDTPEEALREILDNL